MFIARFPYGASEHPAGTDWLVQTVLEAKADPRIGDVFHRYKDDTPITMSRNRVLWEAREVGADLVLMVDNDIIPDLPYPGARPFFSSSLDFMLNHKGPSIVAAPYCGGPPLENVFIFQWTRQESDHPNQDMKICQFSREEAAARGGFEECAALPTGLTLIDMRVLQYIDPPWFEYEYADPPFNTRKATTEDVYFTRNASLAGVPIYVAWDSWAGHVKRKVVGKPLPLTVDQVRDEFRRSIVENRRSDERLIEICSANGFPTIAEPAMTGARVHSGR